ncbi:MULTISPECIES: tyrosine-type recombinase/integrase [Bradyrhizobium]|uniref:Site-specific integrase n=1 Tax=Bradyrhizobium septentrionale TaxID=1404411 RepID=A0A973W174_9BRAD|nr:site-specific integrase [Bradyrhizobium septentrionale]UGY14400.1 site-specific integrase [Bradyrhizobium septentrionale]UGY22880.1 site-specific integrase [Bradyrhizobium septentrionale]
MKVRIIKRSVDALSSGDIIADDEVRGFVARRLASGVVTYGFRYRDKTTNKQRWVGLGLHGAITAEQARTLAKKRAGEVADGRDPAAELEASRAEAAMAKLAEANTVNVVIDRFLSEYVNGADALRSADQIERAFEVYVRPRIGTKSIYELERSDIQTMLGEISKEHGPVMADRVLAYVRKAFNWQMIDDDKFNSPIVRGMARTKPKQRARKRTLSDDEIRDVWTALETAEVPECYPRLLKSLLFNSARRNECSRMHSIEIEADIWVIPGSRYKTKLDHALPLTEAFRELIGEKPAGCRGNSWFIFSTTNGARPFSGFSKAKKVLDAEIAKLRKRAGRPPMTRWTLHDLRRTGRSLMSRAKVSSDHAERVLGHVMGGVRETYDRYEYLDEKREALVKLADLLRTIVGQPTPKADVASSVSLAAA